VGAAWLLGLAGCGAGPSPSAVASERHSPPPTSEVQTAAPTPHQGVITVVDVALVRSSEVGQRVLAIHLSGAVGTSAMRRSLEIRTWTEPIDGSRCGAPPIPMVLRPLHAEAVQPALADQTRTVVVRSQGHPRPGAAQSLTRFRYGPVPSLNGEFEGWVSFHVSASSDGGFCAFDVHGVVVIVAGETTVAELPTVRIDTRDAVDDPEP
jgi:hypothetical protein